ncbi:MAG: type II secretion system protein [Helicobacteraceae bacterium]|jgi:prepilin-type N-terminal cleavage/methylation domain-containing protein|nr:type II secretion system protein [Helicobacteraceae bacterium]
MRKAFTLIELIFVIIIFGIMSSFGADILYKIYENYVYSNTFNRLENQSEAAVKQIANRLQYRIKDSTIARDSLNGSIEPIGSNTGNNETVLEWIATDIDGWRGTTDTTAPIDPDWSGFIDLRASTNTILNSPATTINDTDLGLFFIGSNVDLNGSAFGWDGTTNLTGLGASASIKVVDIAGSAITLANNGNFDGTDVYEYYQLAKEANAVSLEGTDLYLYDSYAPWLGQQASADNRSLIMENVKSFKFTSMGDILVIQVCVSDNNVTGVNEYAICKEKVVF